MKQFAERRKQVEAEFKGFMERSIWNCARNVTRKMTADEHRNSCMPLETLGEKGFMEYMTVEDHYGHEEDIELEIKNFRLTVNSDLLQMLFDGLTEREKQALILHVGFGYDYDRVGKILGISPDRAKAYKYHGLRKARAKKDDGKKRRDML